MDWAERAACRGMPTELFFPAMHTNGPRAYLEARTVCARCPVTAECLDEAMVVERHQARVGMFGGLTPRERERRRVAA